MKRGHLSIGLDVDFRDFSPALIQELKLTNERLRSNWSLKWEDRARIKFIIEIIEATNDLAAYFKLNKAFYEGREGGTVLEEVTEYMRNCGAPFILDAKYGDIGNSSRRYAEYAFEKLGAAGITVNPYGGAADGLDVFFEYREKITFIWCRGSNAGSDEIQNVSIVRRKKLFEEVARKAWQDWNGNGNCGLVVSAIAPKEITRVRKIAGDMPLLIPGFGAQGGDLEKSVKAAVFVQQNGSISLPALFNASRSIVYALNGRGFADAARKKAIEMRDTIDAILNKTRRSRGCGERE